MPAEKRYNSPSRENLEAYDRVTVPSGYYFKRARPTVVWARPHHNTTFIQQTSQQNVCTTLTHHKAEKICSRDCTFAGTSCSSKYTWTIVLQEQILTLPSVEEERRRQYARTRACVGRKYYAHALVNIGAAWYVGTTPPQCPSAL